MYISNEKFVLHVGLGTYVFGVLREEDCPNIISVPDKFALQKKNQIWIGSKYEIFTSPLAVSRVPQANDTLWGTRSDSPPKRIRSESVDG